jgi:hypothetical protein
VRARAGVGARGLCVFTWICISPGTKCEKLYQDMVVNYSGASSPEEEQAAALQAGAGGDTDAAEQPAAPTSGVLQAGQEGKQLAVVASPAPLAERKNLSSSMMPVVKAQAQAAQQRTQYLVKWRGLQAKVSAT